MEEEMRAAVGKTTQVGTEREKMSSQKETIYLD